MPILRKISAFLARFIPSYITNREQEAYKRGFKDGETAGEQKGYECGFKDGKTVWLIEDRRAPASPRPVDHSIYGPARFPVSEEAIRAMRSQVASAVAQELISEPTDSQWKMILSNHPATCVIAGAGAGKSTTLVLRVAFMVVHLGITLDQITVVSFTRAAAKDVREKLVEVLRFWGTPIDKGTAKTLVRTFHSVLFGMAKTVFPGAIFFENLKDGTADEEDIENPFSSSRLNNRQMDELKQAYIELFNTDAAFQEHVLALLHLCDRDRGDDPVKEYNEWTLDRASERDEELVRRINAGWEGKGLWPIPGIEPGPVPLDIAGRQFHANGRVESNGLFVFLADRISGDPLFSNEDTITGPSGDNPISMRGAAIVKKNIVSRYLGAEYRQIDSAAGIDRLKLWLEYSSPHPPPGKAPVFDIALTGERRPAAIYEAFYQQASFIENLDLEVPFAIEKMEAFREEGLERHFCAALALFWPFFEKRLGKSKIMTFNRAFLLLAHSAQNLRALTLNQLRPLTHLLVDEFQDISPQIVAWLRACHRRLAAADGAPSLMAIGDDWQSVYGWRGSSPEFFIRFDDYFPIHPDLRPAARCEMVENFRSVEPILADAGKVMKGVKNKVPKTVTSKRLKKPGDHGVKLLNSESTVLDRVDEIRDLVETQLRDIGASSSTDRSRVMLLSRTNKILDQLYEEIRKRDSLAYYTFHGAKGLEGDVVVLLEDSDYPTRHPLRNRVYKLARLFTQSYDEAMEDEAYRLAYVAITRGKRRVFWYVNNPEGAAKMLEQRSGTRPATSTSG